MLSSQPAPGHGAPRPYVSRAQAESGTRIIENDYSAWKIRAGLDGTTPFGGHPAALQLAAAGRGATASGLGSDLGEAAIRYQLLAHAADSVLARIQAVAGHAAEADALGRLADHARLHAIRLRATSEHMSRTGMAGRFRDRAQMENSVRNVELSYRRWACSLRTLNRTHHASALREGARRLGGAWDRAHRTELNDGLEVAAARYEILASTAFEVADAYPVDAPSIDLAGLLEFAVNARQHAVQLLATAGRPRPTGVYRDLPEQTAVVASHARSGDARASSRRSGNDARRAVAQDQGTRRRQRANNERGGLPLLVLQPLVS